MRVWMLLGLAAVLCAAGATGSPVQTEGMLETAPGVQVYWRSAGSGDQTVIVPGDFLFDGGLDFLAEKHRVILYDMRNRGRSSRVTDASLLTIEMDLIDLEAVRRHFGIESFSTIGYSYLGKMVVMYALQHPERVDRIVQIGPVAMRFGSGIPPVYDNSLDDIVGPEGRAAIREMRSRGFHETDPRENCEREWLITRAGLVGDPANAVGLGSNCEMPNEWPSRIAFQLQHHFASARLAHVDPISLRDVRVPVLTIHGTLDRNAPYGGGREWAASLPDARLLTIKGAAHQAWVDDPRILDDLGQFLSGSWPDRSEDLEIASESWLSQMRGRELVERARSGFHADATKGRMGVFRFHLSGTLYPRSQSRSSTPPFDPFPVTDDVIIDRGSQRISVSRELRWPNFVSRVRMVGDSDVGFEVSGQDSEAKPLSVTTAELRLRYLSRIPRCLIDEALERPGSVRFSGTRETDGERFSLVEIVVEDVPMTLWLDTSERVRRVTRTVPDALLGDTFEEIEFSGDQKDPYRGFPELVTIVHNGAIAAELAVKQIERLDDPAPTAFALPPGGMGKDPAGARLPLSTEQLAEKVWLVSGIGGGGEYRSLVIERSNDLILVEAPLSTAAVESVLEMLTGRFPRMPVRTVVVTHHHSDHSEGVLATMQDGEAELVTSPGNARFFRGIAAAPRMEREKTLPAPEFQLVTGDKVTLEGSGPSVEVHRIIATGHADEMLFVWLPASRILFQGDLLRHSSESPEPSRSQGVALLEAIEQRGLDVERIVGVHGEIATLGDLEAAVAQYRERSAH